MLACTAGPPGTDFWGGDTEPGVAVVLRFREATSLRSAKRGPRTGELPPLPGLMLEPAAIAVRKERDAILKLTVEAAAVRTIRLAAEKAQPGRHKVTTGASKGGSGQTAAKKATRDAPAAPSRQERRCVGSYSGQLWRRADPLGCDRPQEDGKKRESAAVRDPKRVPDTSKDTKRPRPTRCGCDGNTVDAKLLADRESHAATARMPRRVRHQALRLFRKRRSRALSGCSFPRR